jgi:hypothetical protein
LMSSGMLPSMLTLNPCKYFALAETPVLPETVSR